MKLWIFLLILAVIFGVVKYFTDDLVDPKTQPDWYKKFLRNTLLYIENVHSDFEESLAKNLFSEIIDGSVVLEIGIGKWCFITALSSKYIFSINRFGAK